VANEGNANWQDQKNDFYGTIIETLESAEMKKRALNRVHALHPELKDTKANVETRVAQAKDSAIFNVFATGEEPKFTKIFLDALLDEFIAFRQQIRAQGLERALNTFTEAVVKKSQELQVKTEKLEAFRKANNSVVLAEGNGAGSQQPDFLSRNALSKFKFASPNLGFSSSIQSPQPQLPQRIQR